jgi:ABC-type multidrug transport system ATPase subunit/pSer/pThr/pTyr-binding forkhead associated (FHA) protein/ABC-type multidrug transport system permease subunit
VTTIGRESTNDIVVKDDLRVSRHHACLRFQDGTWSIENVSGQNILGVEQEPVQQAIIHNNSTITLGKDSSFIFHVQPATPSLSSSPAEQPLPVQPPPPLPLKVDIVPAPITHPVNADTPDEKRFVGPTEVIRRQSRTMVASALHFGIPTLEVSSNTSGQRKSYPLDKQIINIGRDATNDVVIDDPSISGLHLQLLRTGSQVLLVHPHPERPQTVNGLLYQGRKIRGDESFRKILNQGDIFRIGDEHGTLVTLAYQDGTGIQQEEAAPLEPIRLEDDEVTIGRRLDNKVVLSHPQVSAHHARLVREGGTYRILDLHSTNHIYVNAQLVTDHLLKMGDEIRIGPYRLIYESTQLTQYDESNNIRVDALNLRKVAANQTTLLNNISLTIPPRSFVALVGGSGAGKSTLLDALSGLRPAQQGKVLYNGQDYYQNQAAFNTQIGYVPQDDIVHRDLTVERALYYAAKLRLPGDFTEEQIWQRISEVLEEVELTERRKLFIKKLSGGQRKRVSIAMELLGNPALFFLDEPTSGLDPDLDRKMMALLRKLADKGHTIILITHATNNISICDYICFLATGGRLVYFGPPEEAKAYFDKNDFTEIYSSLSATEKNQNIPEEAEARFRGSDDYQHYIAQTLQEHISRNGSERTQAPKVKRAKRGKLLKQLALLSRRNLELIRNNRSTLFLLLAQAPVIALFLMLLVRFEIGPGVFTANNIVQCQPQVLTNAGPVGIPATTGTVSCDQIQTFLKTSPAGIQYAQAQGGVNQALQHFIIQGQGIDAQRVLFLCAFVAVLNGVINAVREIVKESAIYRRERTVNLGIIPYVLSKSLILGALALFQSASLILIVDAFEPLHQGIFLPVLFETYITLALSALAGMMIGLLASALAPNEDTALNALPFLLIPQIIFAGVEIPLKDGITTTLALLFPTRWTMAGLGTSLGLHGDKLGGDRLLGNDYTYHGNLFSTYSHDDAMNRVLLAWIALALIIMACSIGIGLVLKWKDSHWGK